MIRDGVPNETAEFLLNKAIENCLISLICTENYAISVVLGDIWEKRPKIYVVHEWPEELIVMTESGEEVDLMVYVNGIILNLGCQLVVE